MELYQAKKLLHNNGNNDSMKGQPKEYEKYFQESLRVIKPSQACKYWFLSVINDS